MTKELLGELLRQHLRQTVNIRKHLINAETNRSAPSYKLQTWVIYNSRRTR